MRAGFDWRQDGATKKRDCPPAPPSSAAAACVAGCTPTMLPNWRALGERYWCERAWTPSEHVELTAAASGNTSFFTCPWRPSALGAMLNSWEARRAAGFTDCSPKCAARRAALTGAARAEYEARRAHYYSEVVLDRAALEAGLPHAIEAFFYVAGVNESACNADKMASGDKITRPRCEAFTRDARRVLLRAFGLGAAELPLVRLDVHDGAGAPFSGDARGE